MFSIYVEFLRLHFSHNLNIVNKWFDEVFIAIFFFFWLEFYHLKKWLLWAIVLLEHPVVP